MPEPDAFGIVQGSCGDTMEIYLKINDGTVTEIRFMTDGCGSSIACGSMLTSMVNGKSVAEGRMISKDGLIKALDGLPDEYLHCAALAVDTLQKAFENYMKKEKLQK